MGFQKPNVMGSSGNVPAPALPAPGSGYGTDDFSCNNVVAVSYHHCVYVCMNLPVLLGLSKKNNHSLIDSPSKM
jgi:hypothetical protein